MEGGLPTVPTRPCLCSVAPQVPKSHRFGVWQRHTGEVTAMAPDTWKELSDHPPSGGETTFPDASKCRAGKGIKSPTPSLPFVMNVPEEVSVGAGLQLRAPNAPSSAPPVGLLVQCSFHHALLAPFVLHCTTGIDTAQTAPSVAGSRVPQSWCDVWLLFK